MKRDSLTTNSGNQKGTDARHDDPVVLLGKPQEKREDKDSPPPPPPPAWTRYIDSRLKQFCSR